MNLEQAAATLAVSPRTVQRYIDQGKLHPQKRKGAKNTVLVFDEAEVVKLKADLEAPLQSTALAIPTPTMPVLTRPQATDAPEPRRLPYVPIHHKLRLTLREAVAYSGFSAAEILAAIHAGELSAVKRAGWRILRRDLERWAEHQHDTTGSK